MWKYQINNQKCNQEPIQDGWKDHLETECVQLESEVSWARALLHRLRKFNRQPNVNLTRDVFLMNRNFQTSIQVSEEVNHRTNSDNQVQFNKNLQKVLRRTGLTEEDIIDALEHGQNTKSLVRSFNCSELSNTPSYLYQEKNTNGLSIQCRNQLEVQINYFSHLTDIIKQHLVRPNELGELVQDFYGIYCQKNQNTHFNRCLFELQQFCRVLYQGIVYYYDLLSIKKSSPEVTILVNEDTLINFAVNFLMQHEGTYQIIYCSLYTLLDERIKRTKENLERLKDIEISKLVGEESLQLNNQKQPYQLAIRTLQKIRDKKGPSSKAKVVIKCSKMIMTEIRDFNSHRGASLLVQSDDLMPILQYILIKAQISDMDLHLGIAVRLLSDRMLASTCGYYLTTMQCALEYLDNI